MDFSFAGLTWITKQIFFKFSFCERILKIIIHRKNITNFLKFHRIENSEWLVILYRNFVTDQDLIFFLLFFGLGWQIKTKLKVKISRESSWPFLDVECLGCYGDLCFWIFEFVNFIHDYSRPTHFIELFLHRFKMLSFRNIETMLNDHRHPRICFFWVYCLVCLCQKVDTDWKSFVNLILKYCPTRE